MEWQTNPGPQHMPCAVLCRECDAHSRNTAELADSTDMHAWIPLAKSRVCINLMAIEHVQVPAALSQALLIT